ncbi:MAG: hypothetical protein H6716_02810 [Polyangiaceae bacterium]|nr:hypothetical protein [Polyangiaceae bacterium]
MTKKPTLPANRVDRDPSKHAQDAEKQVKRGKLVADDPGKPREGGSPHPAAKQEAKRPGKLVTRESTDPRGLKPS